MSSATYRRVSGPVGYMYNAFRAAAKLYEAYSNPDVHSAILRTTRFYQQFQRHKLVRENTIDMSMFLPIERKALESVLTSKLDLGELDERPVDAMWKPEVAQQLKTQLSSQIWENPLYSDTLASPRSITDHQARVLSTLAASCLPHMAVPARSRQAVSSFKWYLRLLANTPVVLVLRLRRNLFADDSLALTDLVGRQFDLQVDGVRVRMVLDLVSGASDDADFALRNYHFTHLSSSDLLALAIRTQTVFGEGQGFEQDQNLVDWDAYNTLDDTLCDIITNRHVSFVLMPEGVEVDEPDMYQLKRALPPSAIAGARDFLVDDIPYDLVYDDLYLLTIENSALRYNLEPLLDAVEASPFDVAGVRVSLANAEIQDFFKQAHQSHTPKDPAGLTYDELILMARKARLAAAGPPSGTHALFTRLGQWNLARVTMGCNNNCIYLGPSS